MSITTLFNYIHKMSEIYIPIRPSRRDYEADEPDETNED